MYAVEFETHIENGIVHVPAKYSSLQFIDAKIIILANAPGKATEFDPNDFFASANVSKSEIDGYLDSAKDDWQ